ncbi:MAG: hypothetical protein LBK77_08155, partial [Spirochaetaceae bacterium]|nr:hypothetical protein [Spirochaetaceae bacterium]
NGDYVYIPGIRALINGERSSAEALILRPGTGISGEPTAVAAAAAAVEAASTAAAAASTIAAAGTFILAAPELNGTERELLLAGSLINYNRDKCRRLSGGRDGE